MENENQPITKKDLNEAFDKFSQGPLVEIIEKSFEKFGREFLMPIFENFEDRFTAIDKKFEAMANRLTLLEMNMQAGFSDVNSELFAIKQELIKLNAKLERLDKRTAEDVEAQGMSILHLEEKSKKIDARVAVLEVKLAE